MSEASSSSNLLVDFPHQCKSPAERTDISSADSDIATIPKTMSTDLIVDFPSQSKRHGVQFAETTQLHTYRHEHVDRHELWYSSSDYDLMKLTIGEDIFRLRAARACREALHDDDDNNDDEEENGASNSHIQRALACPCYMGIEHLLSPASWRENNACRARCTQAVLAEQARVWWDWERIAQASLVETRTAVLRARKLGKLHHLNAIRE